MIQHVVTRRWSAVALVVLAFVGASCGSSQSNADGDAGSAADSVTSAAPDASDGEAATAADPGEVEDEAAQRAEVNESRQLVLAFAVAPLPGPDKDFDHDDYLTFQETKTLTTDDYSIELPGSFVEYEATESSSRQFRSFEGEAVTVEVTRSAPTVTVDSAIAQRGSPLERGDTGVLPWAMLETDQGFEVVAAGPVAASLGLVVTVAAADTASARATALGIIDSIALQSEY